MASARNSLLGIVLAGVAAACFVPGMADVEDCDPQWSPMAGPAGTGVYSIFASAVYALEVFDDSRGPALYAAGFFDFAGGLEANGIARWDGVAWEPLPGPGGTGVSGGLVRSLAVFDDGAGPALYAGGTFSRAGGEEVSGLARWDGAAWSAVAGPEGSGVSGGGDPPVVYALAVFDDGDGPALYAGGRFERAGGVITNGIARWDGSSWSALGSGISGDAIHALQVYDDGTGPALFATGEFSQIGGVTVNNIARWDGLSWSTLTGAGGEVGFFGLGRSMAVFDDGSGPGLYLGHTANVIDGVIVRRIARWDGTAWSALAGSQGIGLGSAPYALVAFDDGGGDALFAVGSFPTAGGITAQRAARWDGTEWSPVRGPHGLGGLNQRGYSLAVWDPGDGLSLYAGGLFDTAGGLTVNHVARWQRCTQPACPADLAPPFGVLDIFDVLEFLSLFEAGDPAADLAPPFGVWDIFDIIEFLDIFEQGCP